MFDSGSIDVQCDSIVVKIEMFNNG